MLNDQPYRVTVSIHMVSDAWPLHARELGQHAESAVPGPRNGPALQHLPLLRPGGRVLHADRSDWSGGLNTYTYVVDPLGWVDPLGLAACSGMYNWYKYNRSQGMTATQAYRRINNASPKDAFDYALHRQGMSGSNYPINFKEKFSVGNYKYEIRAHDVNTNAPAGSNSANGSIYRVGRSQMGVNPVTNQGYGWEYGAPDGNCYHTSELKPNSPAYNPQAANDTHIPLPSGVIP